VQQPHRIDALHEAIGREHGDERARRRTTHDVNLDVEILFAVQVADRHQQRRHRARVVGTKRRAT